MVFIYSLALFASALLLFLVQPMVGKMTLPLLGGSPAVWNTCMVFFQAALLAGYAYAHLTVRLLGAKRQAALHLLVLAAPAALMMLPIAVPADAVPLSADPPALWLLIRLTVWVGGPMFVVSATSPLLQSWFAGTGHPAARDPYFLYAASNAGSLLALLLYPALVEPALDVDQQSRIWAVGYAALAVMIAGCAVAMWRSRGAVASRVTSGSSVFVETPLLPVREVGADTVTLRRRVAWVVLAAIPSSLMLGATTHITTNLAPAPLLWIAPLALYLLSFILVFARRPLVPHRWVLRLLPFAVAPVALLALRPPVLELWDIPIHLLALFLAAMACHGELARLRPGPDRVTEYYLLLSAGGVVGGLLNAVVAPLVFDSVAEYPLMLVLACLAAGGERPFAGTVQQRVLDVVTAVIVGLYVLPMLSWSMRPDAPLSQGQAEVVSILVPAAACCVFLRRPARVALCLAAVLGAAAIADAHSQGQRLYTGRNFFGVKTVVRAANAGGGNVTHYFYHGTTQHGAQLRDPRYSSKPLTYYHRKGPMGELFDAYADEPSKRNVAVVGLATGTLASYGLPGGTFTFYEIDPEVKRIAEDPALFTYLAECKAEYEVVLGDGRLLLSRAADGQYGILILDAFSSDAIPAHLLTVEAVRMYMRKLAGHGVLVMHITNSYVDLSGLLARIAEAEGLAALRRTDFNLSEEESSDGRDESEYVALARTAEDLRPLARNRGWKELRSRPGDPLWTDRFSNVLSVLKK